MLLKSLFRTLRLGGALWRRISLFGATAVHRASLAAVGPRSRFQAGVWFGQPDQVRVGADCYLWRGTMATAELTGGTLRIGNGVQINREVSLDFTGGLQIGDGVLISEQAVIYTHDHGLDPRSVPQPRPKVIGPNV